jgi:hypothetical protein
MTSWVSLMFEKTLAALPGATMRDRIAPLFAEQN